MGKQIEELQAALALRLEPAAPAQQLEGGEGARAGEVAFQPVKQEEPAPTSRGDQGGRAVEVGCLCWAIVVACVFGPTAYPC